MVDYAPYAAQLAEGLSPPAKAKFVRMLAATDKVVAEHPEYKPIYAEMLAKWKESTMRSDATVEETQQLAHSLLHIGTPRRDLSRMRREASEAFSQEMKNEVLPKYGAEGKQAMHLFADEMNESVFSVAGKLVYDKDKGGLQWGGLIGALAAGFLGYNMGGGFSTWVGIGATVLGALAGAWVGNQAGDAIATSTGMRKKEEPRDPGAWLVKEFPGPSQQQHAQEQHGPPVPLEVLRAQLAERTQRGKVLREQMVENFRARQALEREALEAGRALNEQGTRHAADGAPEYLRRPVTPDAVDKTTDKPR